MPVDSTTVTLDGLYARRSQDQDASMFIEVPQAPWAGGGTYIGPPLQYQTIDKNNVLTTLANPQNWMVDRSMVNNSNDTIQNFSLNVNTELAKWQFSETLLYSLSTTHNFNFAPQMGAAAFFLPSGTPVFGGYQIQPGAAVPGFIFDPTFNYSDANAWGDDEATYAGLNSSSKVRSAQIDITRDFDDGPLESVKFGAKIMDQQLPSHGFSYYYNNQNARNAGVLTPFAAAVTPNAAAKNILSDYDGPGDRLKSLPFVDPLAWLKKFYSGNFDNLIASPYTVNQQPAGDSDVVETTQSIYALANFKFDNDILPIRGNAGLRYVTTTEKIYYDGYLLSDVVFDSSCTHGQACQITRPAISYINQQSSYSELLPSLNLIGDLRDDMQVRFSASKTITRPTLSQLPATVGVNVNNFTISQGNPNLRPYTSINYDLSYEWYFQPASVFSVAAYDKEMNNFVQSVFSHYNVNTVTSNAGTTPPVPAGTTEFTMNAPVNASTGSVHGVEADYKQVFDFLPSFWSGFGGELNFTYSEGQLDAFSAPASGTIPAITRPAQPFAGLTKLTYNASLFYEKYGISALIAFNHRDSYLAASPGLTPTALPVYANTSIFNYNEPRDEVDMQAAYNITDNFKVFGDVTNLFDAPYEQYSRIDGTDTKYPLSWTSNGRRISLGVTVRY
jgi:TonB-dependent receptor